MKYRQIGRTGISCSEIGLGTWAFASQIYGSIAEADALATIREALELGINVFDTAPLYGDSERNGISEEILGRGLGRNGADVVVSSKFGRYSTENAAAHFNAGRARESVEGSLRRMKRDTIDILFFHSPFSAEDIDDDVWEELDRLKDEGKIRFVGHSISKFSETEGMAREWAAERRIDVVQVVWSLMNREAQDLINDLGREDVGIFARESLANGFLSGAITRDTVFDSEHLNARYSREEIEARVAYVEELSFLVRPPVESLPQAAFRWVLDTPHISLVLSGASNPAQLREGVASSETPSFSKGELERTSQIHVRDFQAA